MLTVGALKALLENVDDDLKLVIAVTDLPATFKVTGVWGRDNSGDDLFTLVGRKWAQDLHGV